MTDRDDVHQLAGAYALGALTTEEVAEYEATLAGSADARAGAAALAETAAQLGLAAEPVAPSPELKARILARIAVTPQLPAQAAAPRVEPSSSEEARGSLSADAAPGRRERTPAETKARSRWWAGPTGMLAAAAVAAALFVGGTVVGQSMVRNDFEVAQATALAGLQTADDAQQAKVAVAGGGEATLIWSLEQRRSVVMIDDLDQLPDGKTYQLWYIGEAGPIAAGTFEAADSGVSWRVLDGLMSGGDVVGVTIEPEGGSEQPTTEPIVAFESA